jgi:hypothetical protein
MVALPMFAISIVAHVFNLKSPADGLVMAVVSPIIVRVKAAFVKEVLFTVPEPLPMKV